MTTKDINNSVIFKIYSVCIFSHLTQEYVLYLFPCSSNKIQDPVNVYVLYLGVKTLSLNLEQFPYRFFFFPCDIVILKGSGQRCF